MSAVFEWFRATYELVDGRWRRQAWPAPGSAGEQDARLVLALEYVADVENERLSRATSTY